MMSSRTQIVATIGPASSSYEVMKRMAESMDVARFNFSWPDHTERIKQLENIRKIERELGKEIVTIADLPGPRIQRKDGHGYNPDIKVFTTQDRDSIQFSVENNIDYIAVSFVGKASDIDDYKKAIKEFGGVQKIMAKIERIQAVENSQEIINAADAIMIARGDLGREIPIEQVPFVEIELIKKAKVAGKPVVTATEMFASMVNSPTPTRAEVTDVTYAVVNGSDAVMLSEETSIGKYPVESVNTMRTVAFEAEKHIPKNLHTNPLKKVHAHNN